MELQYYYTVCKMTGTWSGEKRAIGLFYGKTYNELAANIFGILDGSLKATVEAFNAVYGHNLDFNDSNLSGKCSGLAFGIAPIIALREKWKSGKTLTVNDFKNIDFFNMYDGSVSVTFSTIPETIRDLRDILAVEAEYFGFYDRLPSDYEMEINEEKLVVPFMNLCKEYLKNR